VKHRQSLRRTLALTRNKGTPTRGELTVDQHFSALVVVLVDERDGRVKVRRDIVVVPVLNRNSDVYSTAAHQSRGNTNTQTATRTFERLRRRVGDALEAPDSGTVHDAGDSQRKKVVDGSCRPLATEIQVREDLTRLRSASANEQHRQTPETGGLHLLFRRAVPLPFPSSAAALRLLTRLLIRRRLRALSSREHLGGKATPCLIHQRLSLGGGGGGLDSPLRKSLCCAAGGRGSLLRWQRGNRWRQARSRPHSC
jgi:hypothetical protein